MMVWPTKRHRYGRSPVGKRRRRLFYEPLEARFLLAADTLLFSDLPGYQSPFQPSPAGPQAFAALIQEGEGEPSPASSEPITISLQDGVNGYDGTRDTSVRSDQPTSNYGSRSKLELDGNPDQVSFVRWDTTLIPASSTVTAVSLTFHVVKTSHDSFEVYEALRAWDESTATYLEAARGKPWEVPGAGGATDLSDDVLGAITGPSTGLVTVQLNTLGVAMVQNWLSDDLCNLGIAIQDLNDESTDDLDLSSSDTSTVSHRPKLTITYLPTPPTPPPPTVTVDPLVTNDPTPRLSGTISNPQALISVTVGGQTRDAVNHGDGTWTLANDELAALAQGVYDVAVTATTSANTGTDSTANELTIDLTAPSSTVTFPQEGETYNGASWAGRITGTASDSGGGEVERVQVSIQRVADGQYWSGTAFDQPAEVLLNASGTTDWSVPLASSELTDGDYIVAAHAADFVGNTGSVTSVTFTYDATPPPPPTVTVDPLLTNDSTPRLSGTVSHAEATISVTVGGQTKAGVNHGDGTWSLADNQLAPLAPGVYDVAVTATAGSAGSDSTTDELILDTSVPATTLLFPADNARYRSATWEDLRGTASDTGGAGLERVEVSLQRLSDKRYWSGSAWDQMNPFFLPATGTTSWNLQLPAANLTDGASYTVTVRATDRSGNVGDPSTATWTFDTTRPVLTSFTRQSPTSSPTNADTLVFRATFSERVSRVDAGDFVVTGTTATITDVSSTASKTYDVTVAGGNLADLNGTVGLDLSPSQDIRDTAGNSLPDTEPATDERYVVDNTFVAVPVTVSFQDGLNGYQGTRDASIRGDQATSNYGTRSKLELDGNPDQISLIRWDTSSIPAASTVTAVTITVNVVTTSNDRFEIYEALRAWDEETATYVEAARGQPWEVPGAAGGTDLADDVLGSVTGPSRGLVTIELNALGVAMVQKWISDPLCNLGLAIQDLTDVTTDDLDLSSREHSGLGPKLTVTYTEGPPPPPNDRPNAADDTYSVDEDGSLDIAAPSGVLSNDSDAEGDALSAIRISGPSHGTLQLDTSGSFIYTPDANFYGTDQFTYRADDGAFHGSGGDPSDVGTVTITVNGRPDTPIAVDDSISTTRNSSRTFDVLSNDSDADGDALSVSDHTLPAHGTLTRSGGSFTYTPEPDYTGSDSFRYTIVDGTGRSATATVSIQVTNQRSRVVFRAMGDVPYSQSEYTSLKNDLANVASDDQFFVHLGDIKSGSGACTASVYSDVSQVLLEAERTVFIIPGDNEWNDCSNPSQAWGYWQQNFSQFDEQWTDNFSVQRQSVRDENFSFLHDGVLFVGINLVGGKVHDSKEWAQRMEENSAWVSDNLALYRDQVSSAVLFAHAFPDGARQSFGDAFVAAAKQFQKPILYLMGDKHSWKLDQPFSGAANVTRVIVDQGVPSVRVTVTHDPGAPFQFDRSP